MWKVGAKAQIRTRVRVYTPRGTANAKVNDEGKQAHHHCHHHHRCRRYQPHWRCGASFGLQMGPVGPRKADSEMASLFLPLGRRNGMGDAWVAKAPSTVGAVVYAFVGKIVLRVP